jgi:hypothetical protein
MFKLKTSNNIQVKMPKQRQQLPVATPPRKPKRIVRRINPKIITASLHSTRNLPQVPQQKFPVRRPAPRADAMDVKNQVRRA